MSQCREFLSDKLNQLDKNDLIELLLLSENDGEKHRLRNLKNQLDIFSNHDKRLSLISGNASVSALKNETAGSEYNGAFDVGVYMAYSIFHGYLNLVIPRTGTREPHLEELMQDYESVQKIKFHVYKLFMLIPKSTYCPVSLEEASPRIKKCCPLPEKVITRAGVQDRIYKNSVYKILNEETKRFTYVVAEYATPVQTYKDVLTYNYGKDSDTYKRNKDKVLKVFHDTLLRLLKEHNCAKYCELIFYEDKKEDDGSLRDLADILMESIQKFNN